VVLKRQMRVTLRHNVHACRDPKDDMFLECAALAGADVVVTGDKALLSLGSSGGARIVTPLEYIELPA
jgi:putative PIN family toxin of toxin-antitoxin system